MIQIDKVKVVEAIAPQTGASARTGKYISMKNVLKATIICQIAQATSATSAITLEQSTAVAGTGHTAITNVVPIWSDLDTATSDTLTARTAAVSYTTDAATTNKVVVFEVNPAELDATYDVLNVIMGISHSSSIVSAVYVLDLRDSGADVDAD